MHNVIYKIWSDFNGRLIFRNARLESFFGEKKVKAPRPFKTGTTIAGVVCKVSQFMKEVKT